MTKTSRIDRTTIALAIACTLGSPMAVLAADGETASIEIGQAAAEPPATDPDGWRFQATAYGWLIGVSGSLTSRGQTVDLNASFPQIVSKSDSIAAFMGYVEADKGKVGVYGDLVWTKLGFDRGSATYRNPLPGVQLSARTNTALTTSMTIIEMGGLYEAARWAHAPGSFTAIDGLLGFRYWSQSSDINLNVLASVNVSSLGIEQGRAFSIARSGNVAWVDPVIGVRVRHQFTPSQHLMVRGDVGGFGFASQFAWQAVGVYSYSWQFTGYSLAGVIGYRALAVDYSTGWGSNAAGANLVLHGPLVGFTLRF